MTLLSITARLFALTVEGWYRILEYGAKAAPAAVDALMSASHVGMILP